MQVHPGKVTVAIAYCGEWNKMIQYPPLSDVNGEIMEKNEKKRFVETLSVDDELPDSASGIEVEDLGEDDPPFDSARIEIDFRQPTISNIVARLEDGEIDLAPEFQRQQNLWSDKKQSQLIESIILKIPLPAFYFDEERRTNDDGIISTVWHVVDGLQRLCALRNFILGRFEDGVKSRLKGLEFLHNCENLAYDELPRPYRRIIEETQLTVYLMKPSTPIAVKYNVFKRVNTGGVPLNQQEIRHALNQGPATRYLESLANLPEFALATGGKIKSKRMQDRELVNRFLAFYLQDLSIYRNMDSYLDSVLRLINMGKTTAPLNIVENRFKCALEALHVTLGDMAFKREPNGRLNKALFEALTVLVAKLDEASLDCFMRSPDAKSKYEQLLAQNEELLFAVTTSTGNLSRVRARYEILQKYLDDLIR